MANNFITKDYISTLSLPQQRILLGELSKRLVNQGVDNIKLYNPYQVDSFQFGRYGQDIQPLLIDYANRLINRG